MLTRLHVRGFKNLLDVEIPFGPFTCVAGANGVGKSNLFDAVRFLHLLTQHPIMEAVQLLREARARPSEGRPPIREDPRSLLTAFGEFRAPELELTADLVVDRRVVDDYGVEATAATSAVTYEVAFRLNEEERPERLELVRESLRPIPVNDARSQLGFPSSREFRESAISGRRATALISTQPTPAGAQIKVHQEGHGGRTVPAPKSSRTVLGGLASVDFPTLLAVHREMASWRTLLLEPSAMRAPSHYRDPRSIDSRGANLAAAVDRLQSAETPPGRVCAELANRLGELLDDVRELRVVDDERIETLTLEVRGRDRVFHSARSLSDGTLRFLVLAALALDPEARGLVCLEEPENGIHPERVPAMVDLLRDIAVEPAYAVGPDNPLRQVVVNTHSPKVVGGIQVDELVFLDSRSVVRGASRGQVAHVRVPPKSWRGEGRTAPEHLAPGHVQPYLGGAGDGDPFQLSLDLVAEPVTR